MCTYIIIFQTGASVTDCIMFDGKTHIQMAENGVFTSAPLSDVSWTVEHSPRIFNQNLICKLFIY